MIGDLTQNLLKEMNRVLQESKQSAETAFSAEQFRPVIDKALKQTGLVTREEFDAQQLVLHRTRERVEALERQVKLLEELAANPPASNETDLDAD